MSDKISLIDNSEHNVLKELGALYHNYSLFGVDNDQLPGKFVLNQKAKAPIITAYIAYAIAKSRVTTADRVSFAELFCADGYYAMVASLLGCENSYGIDNDRDNHLSGAKEIANRLKLKNIEFIKADIEPESIIITTDIVANVGGLYHVDNPEKIVELSYNMAKKYLIIQTVVSLASESENYYESPAPGWNWGNRYSRQSFDKMVRKICPNIIDSHFNILEGNKRLEDRGSVYYLIKK